MWRDAIKRQKNREALRNSDTPPQSPDNQNAEQPRSGSSRQHLEGKKQSRRASYKLHKEIAQLQHALTKERKLKEKYKKRLQRSVKQNESSRSKVRELVKNCPVNSRIRKTLLLHEALISDIKRKYQNARNERDKQILAKVTVGKIVKKYRLQRWSEQALGFSKKRRNLLKSKSLTSFTRKTVNRFADTSIQKNIKSFFNRDDVSRITTGRKQTITRNKVKMQKRFLVDTMRSLHRKFLAENNVRISYSSFCRLRPFWVVHPSLSDRETCQCKLHENLSFLAEKLNQLKLIETSDLERLTKTVSCDNTRKDCMYGECENCKDKTVPLSSMYDSVKKVSYTQWGTEEKAKMDDQEGPKLFFVNGDTVEQALERMPSNLPAVPATMRIHQVVTLAPGEILSRDVSCMCSTQKQLQCECWNTNHFSFVKKVPDAVSQRQTQIHWEDPEVLGQWCVLTYDKDLFPGIILAMDETHVQVKCMHRVGPNRFFWPAREDVLWYDFDDVLELIPPPKPVTTRHMEIQKDIWARLSE
ncbi:hypothetical protein DPX16_2187 [Anabarilius grahami]|uniref:Uncharacterized protein n=1 Tax=Anabarilius grahami TaxID=495550 RepID=A0A3N0YR62_ANAGA|nr:hypothetical protein DPX16_2187 [Anabarilius grahami]